MIFDVLLLLLIPLSAIGGYRTGAISQGLGLSGLLVTFTAAWVLGSPLVRLMPDGPARIFAACVLLLGSLAGGYVLGSVAAKRVKGRVASDVAVQADAVTGSILSVACLALLTWFLGVNLALGPFVSVSRELDEAISIRLLIDHTATPPGLMPWLQSAATQVGLPDLLVGLPPVPRPPVSPPPTEDVEHAAQAGLRSSTEVLGRGCIADRYNQGTGFVVRPGYVVTSAHVIAGTEGQFLYDGARRYPATLVAIDPRLDVAVLRVPSFGAPPLELAQGGVGRGAAGAVVGFPGGYHPTTTGVAVRGTVDVLAHDIYGQGLVHRQLYELQARVTPGDSGGPFVLSDGTAAGMVAYSSVLDGTVAYAVPSSVLELTLLEALSADGPVSSGDCVLGH
jgi:S1-C subfamily serine protease